MTLRDQLEKLDACSEARDWAGGKTLEQAWLACERGDWMLWYAHRVGVGNVSIAHATNACVASTHPVNGNEFAKDGLRDALSLAADVKVNGARGEHALYAALRTCWGTEDYPSSGYVISDDNGSYSADRAALNKQFADIVRAIIPIEVLLAPRMAMLVAMEALLK